MNVSRIPDDRRGFVLVGVAMFILVLTILGLSLFSLSGFESQFTIKSLHRSAAFSAASGGLQRARFALLTTDRLESVKDFLPRDGVIYARAIQGPDPEAGDSTGNIDQNGDDIWVRVRAQQDGATVELQARFEAEQPQDYYKRLITSLHVFVNAANEGQTFISGQVAQPNFGNMDWQNLNPPPPPSDLNPPGRPPIEVRNSMQLASLSAYYNTNRFGPPAATQVSQAGNHYTLNAGFGNVKWFYSPPDNGQWNVDNGTGNPDIKVGGTAIWLLKAGTVACMRFSDRVTITALTPDARLIIVAETINDIQEIQAVEFNGGIMDGTPGIPMTGVPLIIVTPGIVQIASAGDQATMVGYLSIYAGRVQLQGPSAASGNQMHLWHLPSMLNQPAIDPLMNILYGLNILPNVTIGADKMSFVPGTWQVIGASSN